MLPSLSDLGATMENRKLISALTIFVFLSASACKHVPSPMPATTQLETTSGSIAVDNLEAQIEGELRLAKYKPLTNAQRVAIAELTSMRGQFLGRIADYELVEKMAEDLVRDAPQDAASFLLRASARSTFHRFPEALQDIKRAQELGGNPTQIESAQAAIWQATGKLQEALAIRKRNANTRPTMGTLGALATVHAELGEIEEAERLFKEAPTFYRDVSPFPVAWLSFQRARMWIRQGETKKARDILQEAHLRLPQYAAVQGHLGELESELGSHKRAISLLQPLAESSDDPDYAGQLARILTEAGETSAAKKWRDVAAVRHDALMLKHPEAFADHACEFWLAAGDNPTKALKIAQFNLGVRQTARAYALLLQAALAADDKPATCSAFEKARTFKLPWPALSSLLATASSICALQP